MEKIIKIELTEDERNAIKQGMDVFRFLSQYCHEAQNCKQCKINDEKNVCYRVSTKFIDIESKLKRILSVCEGNIKYST